MKRLVLWDIDHTLISTRGVGRELSATAFEATTGQKMRKQAKIDGITEPVIFRETAKLHGIDTDRTDFEAFACHLAKAHHERADELRDRGHALPGAVEALDAFAALPGVVQTVVSGNVRTVAEIKLQIFGLDRHIRWDVGAYGEDDDERAELVHLALQRASVAPTHAILIGDTPADVAAARDNAVRVIAVATGRSDEAELRATGSDVVLPNLLDIDLHTKLLTEQR
ncbi:HAD family hydrolase [Streptomyces boninensis]|uniref:HAD family hydrolase n=1 Tax=Streptomyces boninensis TaxID=2039455 RepID=UPI003B226F84